MEKLRFIGILAYPKQIIKYTIFLPFLDRRSFKMRFTVYLGLLIILLLDQVNLKINKDYFILSI